MRAADFPDAYFMLNSHMHGFLGTWASFPADLNLLIQLTMGVSLIAGTLLARAKRYVAHGICQTTVVILNLMMIVVVMGPPFAVNGSYPGFRRTSRNDIMRSSQYTLLSGP